jgi:hypothetical protein
MVYDTSMFNLSGSDRDGIVGALEGEVIRDVSAGDQFGDLVLLMDSGRQVTLAPRREWIEVRVVEPGEPLNGQQEGMLG